MLQAEVVQVHVIGNIVVGVDTAGVIARANAAAAYVQVEPEGEYISLRKAWRPAGVMPLKRKQEASVSAAPKPRMADIGVCCRSHRGSRHAGYRLDPMQSGTLGVLFHCIRDVEERRLVRWALIHWGNRANTELEAALRRKTRRFNSDGIMALDLMVTRSSPSYVAQEIGFLS